MGEGVLLEEGEGELDDSAKEVGEVLIQHEGLDSREDGEGEAFEDFLEPDLVADSAVDVGHLCLLNKIINSRSPYRLGTDESWGIRGEEY